MLPQMVQTSPVLGSLSRACRRLKGSREVLIDWEAVDLLGGLPRLLLVEEEVVTVFVGAYSRFSLKTSALTFLE